MTNLIIMIGGLLPADESRGRPADSPDSSG